jgi:hypothetical protein
MSISGNPGGDEPVTPAQRRGRWAMAVAWPSFLAAGLLEALVFGLVDPSDLSRLGEVPFELSRQAIYTLAFLVFWLLVSLAASLSLLLATQPDPPANPHPRGWPR